MEVSVRELKNRLSEYLKKVREGRELVVTSRGRPVARLLPPRRPRRSARAAEETIARLRSLPWIRPGKGKLRLPKVVVRLRPREKTLAETVSEERG